MLHVVTIRREGERTAHNHIVADDTRDRTFCGDAVPLVVLEMWGDPRNPYQGKGNISCVSCISEFQIGRRMGWRGDTPPDPVSAPDPAGAPDQA